MVVVDRRLETLDTDFVGCDDAAGAALVVDHQCRWVIATSVTLAGCPHLDHEAKKGGPDRAL